MYKEQFKMFCNCVNSILNSLGCLTIALMVYETIWEGLNCL